MGRLGAGVARKRLRRAAGCLVLLSLLLLTLSSDLMHNHPGADAETAGWGRASSEPGLAPACPPAGQHRPLPCLACLYHRTPCVDSAEGLPAGGLTASCREQSVVSLLPPPPPTILRADPRAPPASC